MVQVVKTSKEVCLSHIGSWEELMRMADLGGEEMEARMGARSHQEFLTAHGVYRQWDFISCILASNLFYSPST
jgi:hypothetical protein